MSTAPGAGAPAPAGEDAYEGAGVVSSIHDMLSAAEEQDATGVLTATVVAALDALDYVEDPLRAMAVAGVGWALEHVAILREPLDALCGDARQIEDRAEDWERLSRELAARAAVLDGTAAATATGWSGPAAADYRAVARSEVEALCSLSDRARDVAEIVLSSGVAVGTERSIIRDLVAEFLVRLIPKLVAAVSAAVVTAGAAGPAAAGAFLLDIVDFAGTLLRRVRELAVELRRAAELAERVRAGIVSGTPLGADDARAGLAAATQAGAATLDATLEAEKQAASARATRAEWGAPATSTRA